MSAAPPYGRLPGCPSSPVELSAGVVLDHGFVAARGGASAALAAAGAAFALTNALFEDQLGVRLRVQTVVVHDGPSTDDAPNDAPTEGSGTRSCALYADRNVSGHGATVALDGVSVALGVLSAWVGSAAAPTHGVWHLLTDCFPPPGRVGLATVGTVCAPAARSLSYVDTGAPPAAGAAGGDLACVRVAGSGHCADVTAHSDACTGGSAACQANTAVSSDSPTLWRTVAHEIAHNLGAEHTEDRGGLMAYTGEKALVDNGDVCTTIADVRDGADDCFVALTAVCGNGAVEEGEGCDDGGVADGDGCDAACAVECGWACAAPLDPSASGGGHASVCERLCGNGVVDAAYGEECDAPGEACCNADCTLAAGAACCGGECCAADGSAHLPTTASCGGGGGRCGGECRMAEPFCERYALNMAFDPAACRRPPSSRARRAAASSSTPTSTATRRGPRTSPAPTRGSRTPMASREAADGAAGGCRAGVCVPLAVCGNGVVEPARRRTTRRRAARPSAARRRRRARRVPPGAGVRGGADDRRRRLRARGGLLRRRVRRGARRADLAQRRP